MLFVIFKNCENIPESVGAPDHLARDRSRGAYASSPLYIRATCSPYPL
jgi:hypothetical protein